MNETLDLEKYINNPSLNMMVLNNHIGRYHYAIKKIDINQNDEVLDISCGQGYGTYIIAHNGKNAYGSDINSGNIIKAKSLFKKDNLIFLDNLGMPKEIDKIICIETIEHIKIEHIPLFIDRLFESLKKDGKIFFSFPIGENKKSDYNEYHLCEPSLDFIFGILKNKMSKINIEISKYVNDYDVECNYCFLWGRK